MGELTFERVVEDMKEPSTLTPRKVFEYTSFLAALYAERHSEATEAQIERGGIEATLIGDGKTAAAARAMGAVSEAGIREMRLRAALKSIEEMIRALKKMGAYLSEESRNQY